MMGRRHKALAAEQMCLVYDFPDSLHKAFAWSNRETPWEPVLAGLRDWFICLAYAEGPYPLGLRSRTIETVWELFTGDELYPTFCDDVFGRKPGKLHPVITSAIADDETYDTIRAWGRSETSKQRECLIWNLDERMGIENALGVGPDELALVRDPVDMKGGEWTRNPANLGPFGQLPWIRR